LETGYFVQSFKYCTEIRKRLSTAILEMKPSNSLSTNTELRSTRKENDTVVSNSQNFPSKQKQEKKR
jgi:hypothetical protein